jgi:translation initiation factor IF-2
MREAEEARMTALEDARRREEQAKVNATEDEKKRAEDKRKAEEEAARQAEEAAKRKIEEDARAADEADTAAAAAAPVEAPAPAPAAAPAPEAPAPRTVAARPGQMFQPVRRAPPPAPPKPPVQPQQQQSAPQQQSQQQSGPAGSIGGGGAASPSRRPEPARPARPGQRGGDDRRHSGKLTVTRALAGDDDRSRSLAALRRAREKEKRAYAQSGPREKQVRDVVVPDSITVGELANRMAEKAADLVKALFKMGTPVTVNQSIDQDTAELLVTEFGHNIKRVSESDVDIDNAADVDAETTLLARPPVVTIMGHVDHGKTSLLDAIRGANVVSGEAGGITQHIGAYQVKVPSGDMITFLDTPGHEAFSEMRARGANVTDIVVLVVAADDGLRPQTVEAINHTKAAGVPMIVAINKIDKPEAKAQRVREELLQHEIVVEQLGGDVQDVEVSALKGLNLDGLLDAIALQAEILELRANPARAAEGTVIEAKLDKGRGPLATVLVQRGTLKVGDVLVVGAASGKVRAMTDAYGKQVKEAGPSMPVEVLGLGSVPSAGDQLTVVENEARAREVAAYRQGVLDRKRTTAAPMTLENMFANKASTIIEFPLVVKADVQGSAEAIVNALNRLSTDEIKVRILNSGVGAITESDVTLASATGAPIIGFPAGKRDKAAGLLVLEGTIRKGLHARLTREDVIVSKTTISSLRRFKDDVAQVIAGLECGVLLADTNDIKAGDNLEVFEVEERARTL